jgi:hypothetical protein
MPTKDEREQNLFIDEERNLFIEKSSQLDEKALIEIERHRSIQEGIE